ncbi:MAG: hypothetical protein FJ398_13680 [Verrucomicrobia bacterium]|nr:hypothetical protein [Verrucomicrobiota bacterium]
MHLLRSERNQFVFEIGKREKRLLQDTLRLYPLIPASHHQVTRLGDGDKMESNQRLLEEALAEQRAGNKKQLEAMLSEEGRFKAVKTGFHLTLTPPQTEWLLQVLNDVRVGCWLRLGQPDEKKGKNITLTPDNARYLVFMEACAHFESVLLSALEH